MAQGTLPGQAAAEESAVGTLTESSVEMGRYIGSRMLRKEDALLVTGHGRFLDNLSLPGMVWVAVVRSPMAHARITRVDTSPALQLPGVVAAYSGADLASEWAAGLPCAWPIAPETRIPTHWPVAQDKACLAGDPVAVVVADTREHAVDAAEAVDVDYEQLPAVTSIEEALAEGAPVIHEEFGDNICFKDLKIAAGDVDKVFAKAPVTVKERYYHPRLIPNAMEPRGVLAQPMPVTGEMTLWSSTQIPHILRTVLALTLGIPESKFRVIAPDVGGGFGSKLDVYGEEAICLAVARKLGVPVKWVEERSEGYVATIHGRDVIQEVEVAATEEGRLLGVRAKVLCDMGAYCQLVAPGIQVLGATLFSGVYKAEAASFECTAVFTNRTPTDAYRGAGRPEATYAIERIMDALARRVGKDPAEVRRMNFLAPFSEPTANVFGAMYDSGNYQAGLDKALELAGYEGLRREQAERRQRGDVKQLGIGLSTYIEACGSAPSRGFGAVNFAAGGWEAATTETGLVRIVKYVAVDDCGNIVNPMIAQGMIHGGVAQGIAEGLYEEATYDENGTLLTGNMSSYRVPSAAELPTFVTDHVITPSTSNPGGWKGVGEAGTIGSPPAVVNAVIDALSPLGITDIGMPATPERVWRAIHAAKSKGGQG